MRTLVQISLAVGAAATAAGLLAGCGGSTGSASPAAAQAGSSATSGTAAYLDCLRQNGATVPTAFASRNRPTGGFTARPTGTRPSGGFGGFGGFGGASQDPAMQKAVQACASVRPSGAAGFGGFGGGRGGTQLTAFRNCMTQQGVAIPTTRPTAVPTATAGGERYLNGLNPSDPKVAAALKVCDALLPSPGARPSGSATS
jgi:hypothetical protein